MAFRRQQVKRRKLQVADRMNRPAIATVRIHVTIHSFEPLLCNRSSRSLARQHFAIRGCSNAATASVSDACAAAPTAAYCCRNNSCALADHGINSASRQTQSVCKLIPEICGVQSRPYFFKEFLLNLCVVEESSSCARIADPDAFIDDTETSSRRISVAADDHHGARTHMFFFANDARTPSRRKVCKCFGWVFQKPGLCVVSVGDIVGGK